jgi:arylamine N-acetyltransferase
MEKKKEIKEKLIYLEGMGGPAYPLNTCSVLYRLRENGEEVEVIKCEILWGHPSCEGCPRDEILKKWI